MQEAVPLAARFPAVSPAHPVQKSPADLPRSDEAENKGEITI